EELHLQRYHVPVDLFFLLAAVILERVEDAPRVVDADSHRVVEQPHRVVLRFCPWEKEVVLPVGGLHSPACLVTLEQPLRPAYHIGGKEVTDLRRRRRRRSSVVDPDELERTIRGWIGSGLPVLEAHPLRHG